MLQRQLKNVTALAIQGPTVEIRSKKYFMLVDKSEQTAAQTLFNLRSRKLRKG